MKDILEQLNRSVGINGTAVVTRDGIPVMSRMPHGADEDKMAAIGSSLILSIVRSLGTLPQQEVQSLWVEGSRGRILLVNAGPVYLLVVTDPKINLDTTMLDIKSAAGRLERAVTMDTL